MNDKTESNLFEETRIEWTATPRQMDEFWATGWRHFGPIFFRSHFAVFSDQVMAVKPLRVVLDRFRPSKSQRRVLRKNADLITRVGPTVLNDDLRKVFEAHVQRFKANAPPNLEAFLGYLPDKIPCENVTLAVHLGERLVAASFLDLGLAAVSSVYGIFDPAESGRSLGIFTMLKEIEYAAEHGRSLYYHGYACDQPSPYDYKKRFAELEFYDWKGTWRPLVEPKA